MLFSPSSATWIIARPVCVFIYSLASSWIVISDAHFDDRNIVSVDADGLEVLDEPYAVFTYCA